MASKRYDDIRESLDTGDIVLFSGKGPISAGIRWVTRSRWSHVGMVLKLEEWETVLLWESTILTNLKDAVDGKAKRGVQLVVLSDRINTYRGEIAMRRLDIDRTDEMTKALRRFRGEVRNRPYEKDKIEFVKAAYDLAFGENQEDLSSLFCSELVAEAYQRMGLLREPEVGGTPSNEYTPKDFSTEGRLDLVSGALEDEVTIRPS